MKGSDVLCPECGAGTDQIAPEVDLGAFFLHATTRMDVTALCRNGHRIFVTVCWDDAGHVTSETVAKP